MSKLVELVVVKQLMQHIKSNNLYNPRQSAYKSNHSTEIILLHIRNEIYLYLGFVLISPFLIMCTIFVRYTSFKFAISGGLDST